MTLPQFNIFLYSPTSTSAQIAVAVKFCGSAGIVMEFDNSSGKALTTAGFDCSWISRFKEEDERYDSAVYFAIYSDSSDIQTLLSISKAVDYSISKND